ncbi:hypothetical protein OF83DRAFT_1118905 [Amylostereum chailletii]|nr:hypothetical protein OF83DRAFT_1118905 [Amylostereum chailletii]
MHSSTPSLPPPPNDGTPGSTLVAPALRKARLDSTRVSLNGRRSGRLKSLPSMPLDILVEVFLHSSPQDLHRIARTTKAFRRLLMSRQFRFIWVNALRQEDGIPPCPEDTAEPAWAWLLFGERVCNACNAKAKVSRIFEVRQRLCATCLKDRLVDYGHTMASSVATLMGIQLYELDTYIPQISSSGTTWSVFGWSRKDVEDTFHELQDLRLKCVSDNEWPQTLSDFKARMRDTSTLRKDHAKACMEWVEHCRRQRQEELDNLKETRKQLMCDRLAELGYDPQDIRTISTQTEFKTGRLLTEKIWLRLLPSLTSDLASVRDGRLERERSSRRYSRESAISIAYREFQKKIPSKFVSLMPSEAEMYALGPIAAFVEQDVEAPSELNATTRTLVLQARPTIDTWIRKRIQAILLSIPADRIMPFNVVIPSSSPTARSLYRLDLATNVAVCNRCSPREPNQPMLFGLEQLTHHCVGHKWSLPDVGHVSHPSQLVEKLVDLFAMDVQLTMCQSLDDMDHRFVCEECHSKPCGVYSWSCECMMTWKDLVSSFFLGTLICRLTWAPSSDKALC